MKESGTAAKASYILCSRWGLKIDVKKNLPWSEPQPLAPKPSALPTEPLKDYIKSVQQLLVYQKRELPQQKACRVGGSGRAVDIQYDHSWLRWRILGIIDRSIISRIMWLHWGKFQNQLYKKAQAYTTFRPYLMGCGKCWRFRSSYLAE